MHRWIGTDNGSQCFACGLVLDYVETDESGNALWESRLTQTQQDAAFSLAFGLCSGPETGRAHHYVIGSRPASSHMHSGGRSGWEDIIECAYGDSTVGPDDLPRNVNPECIGA
jgi:hypothetical protein